MRILAVNTLKNLKFVRVRCEIVFQKVTCKRQTNVPNNAIVLVYTDKTPFLKTAQNKTKLVDTAGYW